MGLNDGYKLRLMSFDGALMEAMKRGVEILILRVNRDKAASQKEEPRGTKQQVRRESQVVADGE